MDKLFKFFSQRRCWKCKYRYNKSDMLLFIGGYVCKDCYVEVKQQLATNNIYVKGGA